MGCEGSCGAAWCESRLHTDRTPNGLYRAGELDQKAVAGSFNHSTLVLIKLSPSEKWTLQKVAEGRVSP